MTDGSASPPPAQDSPSPPKPAKSIPRLAMVEPFVCVDVDTATDASVDSTAPTLTPATSRTDIEIQISPPRPHFETLNLSLSSTAIKDTPRPEPEDSTARSSVDGSTTQRSSPSRLAPLLQETASTASFHTSRGSPTRPSEMVSSPTKQRTAKLLARIVPASTLIDDTPPITISGSTAVVMPSGSFSFVAHGSPPRQGFGGALGSAASTAALPLKASPPKQPADSPTSRNMEKSPSASRRGLFPSLSRASMELM